MKALSIWQPYASLLAMGKKHEETRSWKTNYRGEILIHAAKKDMKEITFYLKTTNHEIWEMIMDAFSGVDLNNLPYGAIIGKAKLTDCKLIDGDYNEFVRKLCPAEYVFGDFTVGRYAWVMEEPVLFEKPIPAAGKQGLWNWEGELNEAKEESY